MKVAIDNEMSDRVMDLQDKWLSHDGYGVSVSEHSRFISDQNKILAEYGWTPELYDWAVYWNVGIQEPMETMK